MICSVGLCGAACGRVDRARECQALVATVNPALDAIERRQDAGVGGVPALLEIAARYERLAFYVGRLRFSSEELRRDAGQYAEVFSQTAKSTRTVAAALGRGDINQLARARGELGTIVRREKSVARRIERQCVGSR